MNFFDSWFKQSRVDRMDAAANEALYAVDKDFAIELGYKPPPPLAPGSIIRLGVGVKVQELPSSGMTYDYNHSMQSWNLGR